MIKKITFYPILFLCLFQVLAQNDNDLCQSRLERLAERLITIEHVDDHVLNLMETSISKCYGEDGISYFLKGLIEINKGGNKDYGLARSFFEKSDEYGYLKSKTFLAYFHKNGWNTNIDLVKAQSYLEDAAFFDNTAKYSLGYFYFKGLNRDSQNYEMALRYFEESDNPMSNHWLAISYIFGLGCNQDYDKGIELLSSSNVINSKSLLDRLESNTFDVSDLKELGFSIKNDEPLNIEELFKENLDGGFFELEWSSQKVISEHSISLILDREKSQLNLKIDENEISSQFSFQNNKIVPSDLSIHLPALILDNPSIDKYTYQINGIEFCKSQEENAYIGKVNTWIKELNEPGQPMIVYLMSNKLLEQKIKSSLSIYPNPVRNQFQVNFTLEKPSNVSLEIYDINGLIKVQIDKKRFFAGRNSIDVIANDLSEGVYIASLIVDSSIFTKRVLKIN